MNILQKIVVLVWGLLVSLKFRNIPKYVELENVKLKVTDDDGYKSMQHFNDYGAIIPDIIIYTVIAIVLYIVLHKIQITKRNIKESFKNENKNIVFLILSVCYFIFIVYQLTKGNTYYVYEYDIFIYPLIIYVTLTFIILFVFSYLLTITKKGSN